MRLEVDPLAQPDPPTFTLIRHAFRHRRKTLKKNLRMAGLNDARVAEALERLELDPRVRAEVLSVAQFRALADVLAAPT